jgi:hypothetical protein
MLTRGELVWASVADKPTDEVRCCCMSYCFAAPQLHLTLRLTLHLYLWPLLFRLPRQATAFSLQSWTALSPMV